jgi:hypothetical protein
VLVILSGAKARPSHIFTKNPDIPAPELLCPRCDHPLEYRQTVIGGVTPRERWDYLECHSCGLYEYRERTRRLRPTTDVPMLIRRA